MPPQFCSSSAPALSGSRLPPRTWPSGQPEPAFQPLCLFSPLLTPQLSWSLPATASVPHMPRPHPGFQDSAQSYSLSWDALPTSSCGSAQMSLYRQEAPVTLPAEVPSWHCMWPWDWHLASSLHWRQLCFAEWAWSDQRLWVPRNRAEWVDPVPARGSWGHIPSAAQVPSQRSPLFQQSPPAQLLTPADGSGSQPCPG